MKSLQFLMRLLRGILPPFVIISAITNLANFTIRIIDHVNPPAQQQAPPVVCPVKTETK